MTRPLTAVHSKQAGTFSGLITARVGSRMRSLRANLPFP
jgi:hypothetical protein